jgi:signal transduction histidine kinase
VLVTGDPEQLSRVLDNLLNNALTYRRGNQPPWVRLELVLEDGHAGVAVEDRGRGVPFEMRERIFERFVRADDGSDRTSGTGLGLYISQQLAQRHGGTVELERSELGEGSRFVLRLPLRERQ